MSDGTKISWSDATWNVVTGCTKISEGCLRCYIDRTPPFRMAQRKFNGPGIGATTGVKLHSDRLHIPLRWRKPRMIFVCSLADLFHDEVPDRFIAEVFAVISLAPRHVFQVLTKRHARLRMLLNTERFWSLVDEARTMRGHRPLAGDAPHVLENAWIGVSTENQKWADMRIPALLQTPAAVRWISAEPLLGPINLHDEWLTPNGLSWGVTGGESGHHARPMHPHWARGLRDQCVKSGVAFHFKQWGEWAPTGTSAMYSHESRAGWYHSPDRHVVMDDATGAGKPVGEITGAEPPYTRMYRVGKKAAGRTLDGREWNGYPRELAGGAA
jgi:protein gp37